MRALQIHENDLDQNADQFLTAGQINNFIFPESYIEKRKG